MVEKDVMVIVPIGEYSGIKMWRSEAIKQGLTYKVIGKEYAAEIEDKMVEPVENKDREIVLPYKRPSTGRKPEPKPVDPKPTKPKAKK